MLKLKLNHFDYLMRRAYIGKDPDAGKDRRREKGMTEDEMVGWHHQLNRHEFEQALGDSKGQGGLVCCSPRGRRIRHDLVTEQHSFLPAPTRRWAAPTLTLKVHHSLQKSPAHRRLTAKFNDGAARGHGSQLR